MILIIIAECSMGLTFTSA